MNGALSGTAASDCSVSHGLPLPWCVTVSVSLAAAPVPHGKNIALLRKLPGAAGAPNILFWCAAPVLSLVVMRSTLRQSTLAVLALALASIACVTPVTGTDSNLALNLSSARPPHRLAVVVCHAPFCWRPIKPLASRAMSPTQAGSSITASIRRAVFTSPLTISHHQ